MTTTEIAPAPVPAAGRWTAPAPRVPRDEPTAEDLLARLAELPPDVGEARRLRGRIIEHYRPRIAREVRRYRNRGVADEDLQQIALVGVLNAIRGFDPAYGKPFISYLLPMMTGEIKRYFRDNTWAVRPPRACQEMRTELNRFRTEFVQSKGRDPSQAEIGGHFGLDAAGTNELLCVSAAYTTLSLDRPVGEEENGEDRVLGDTLGTVDADLESLVERDALKGALSRLPARERRIVLMRFFGERSQAEIAQRVGVSQMQISRLLNSTLAALQRELSEL